jgi:hypothetical protein
MDSKICECCGSKIVEYCFSFNAGLARSLIRLIEAERASGSFKSGIEISKLGMTTSQWTNFQKLRYWGLIEAVINEENYRKRGWWRTTYLAWSFVTGSSTIRKNVWLYRNKVIRFEGDHITIQEALKDPSYKYIVDYAEEARPHLQGDLLWNG